MRRDTLALLSLASCLVSLVGTASGIILYSGDNAANLSAPDAARTDLFNSVAKVTNATQSSTYGSAVHLRGKYMLTANHVSLGTLGTHVTFDGVTLYARDTTFAPKQIGTTDMKLFKLVVDPGLPETPLHTTSDGAEFSYFSKGRTIQVIGTMVGWGRGRNPADVQTGTDRTWNWGGTSTITKRWGTNEILASEAAPTQDYNYTALRTNLNVDAGNFEAGATQYDSGSGLFILGNGVWRLAGLTTMVTNPNTSAFSTSSLLCDRNYFVRISNYVAAIEAEIPDLSTFSGWKIDQGLAGSADSSDADADGVPLLMEFAFGGDPHVADAGILPLETVVDDGGNLYLELSLTRPQGLQGLTYLPQTTSDLTNWPADATGIVNPSPTPVSNGDGTETLTYRRATAVSASARGFMRVTVSAP